MKRNQLTKPIIGKRLAPTGLKEKLEYHYQLYDRTNIAPDPIQFPHRFTNPVDIELIAFLASVYAFGNVKQISVVMEKILRILGPSPSEFLKTASKEKLSVLFSGVVHRFYGGEDSVRLMIVLNDALNQFHSLGNLVRTLVPQGQEIVPKMVIAQFHKWFIMECLKSAPVSHGLRFMIPDPEAGSSCKRFNLFLRWMVRKDEIDFGLWDFISPADLVIPVDTHIAQIARELGLTSRKNADWKMAEEITERLRGIDPADPVRFDFSLCHIGIRGLIF